MFISVEPSSPAPLYRQIMDQVRVAVAAGRLTAGQRLPGSRELADQLQINLQTVVKAYRELAREGVLEMRRGLGTFVVSGSAVVRHRNCVLRPRIAELCRDARVMGLSREALLNLVRESWKEGGA